MSVQVETVIDTVITEAPPLAVEAVEAAETAAETMEAAEAAGANVTPEVTAAADIAGETADALVAADAITENVPAAAEEVNVAVDPQPAVAGGAGAAAPAAASDGAGEVRTKADCTTGKPAWLAKLLQPLIYLHSSCRA